MANKKVLVVAVVEYNHYKLKKSSLTINLGSIGIMWAYKIQKAAENGQRCWLAEKEFTRNFARCHSNGTHNAQSCCIRCQCDSSHVIIQLYIAQHHHHHHHHHQQHQQQTTFLVSVKVYRLNYCMSCHGLRQCFSKQPDRVKTYFRPPV